MNILIISDEESKSLWDYYRPEKLAEIDLILSCGDLKPRYLSFLATFCKGPVLYVHGNHDGSYAEIPPEGCICIEDQIYEHNGIRILGLGGCRRYNDGPYQYTEKEMKHRIRKLRFRLWRRKGFDILLTHSPARCLGDEESHVHKGFLCFVELIEKYKPKYHFHGHVHLSYGRKERRFHYMDTEIINGFETYRLEYESGTEFR